MENYNTESTGNSVDNAGNMDKGTMEISKEGVFFLSEAAKWARFISIINYILVGFMALVSLSLFFSGSIVRTMTAGYMGVSTTSIAFLYLIMAIVYFFLAYFLGGFASKVKKAMLLNDTSEMTAGLGKLRMFFLFTGIMIIVGIVFGIIGGIYVSSSMYMYM